MRGGVEGRNATSVRCMAVLDRVPLIADEREIEESNYSMSQNGIGDIEEHHFPEVNRTHCRRFRTCGRCAGGVALTVTTSAGWR